MSGNPANILHAISANTATRGKLATAIRTASLKARQRSRSGRPETPARDRFSIRRKIEPDHRRKTVWSKQHTAASTPWGRFWRDAERPDSMTTAMQMRRRVRWGCDANQFPATGGGAGGESGRLGSANRGQLQVIQALARPQAGTPSRGGRPITPYCCRAAGA